MSSESPAHPRKLPRTAHLWALAGLGVMGFALWNTHDRWGAVIFGLGLLQLVFWRSGIREHVEREEERERRISDADLAHLLELRSHLPAELPEGWSAPWAHRSGWTVEAGPEDLHVWVPGNDPAARLNVLVAASRKGARLDEERTRELLRPFRHIGGFVEVGKPLAGCRRFAAERLPAPRSPAVRPVAGAQTLDREHLVMRQYLPAKMPPGWAAPVATRPDDDERLRPSWMIETHDGHLVDVTLWPSSAKDEQLLVLFARHDSKPVTPAAASEMLRYFRGVAEFREVDTEGAAPPGSRVYVGQLRRDRSTWVN